MKKRKRKQSGTGAMVMIILAALLVLNHLYTHAVFYPAVLVTILFAAVYYGE